MANDFEKQLASLCERTTALGIAIKYRIDFFELMRCETEEEYNRENPLYPLSKGHFNIIKKIAKEIEKECLH